jgi:hypothetical protein
MLLFNQNPPQTDIFGALRLALQSVFGSDLEVIKGLSNYVAQPLGDYIAMTPLLMERLSTNGSEYTETTRTEKTDIDYHVQLDFYGKQSSNRVTTIFTLWRSDVLFQYGITPFYTSEPRQLQFVGGDSTMIERWSMDVHLAYNPNIILPQQTANQLTASLSNVV